MTQLLKNFLLNDCGAVTIDWVVITAAVVGMSAISFSLLEDASFEVIDAAGSAVAEENDF